MTLHAADVMTTPVTTLPKGATIQETLDLLREERFSGLPVVDGEGRAVGIVSQNDVLKGLAYVQGTPGFLEAFQADRRKASTVLLEAVLEKGRALALERYLARPVEDIMTREVIACAPETPLADVCKTIVKRRVHRIVVLDPTGRVCGIISTIDLVERFGEVLSQR